ncbi:MAG: radical SAM protein [Lachnospiraceae bacterium]|nr:radical SAM protein [Lachnospiraceae bacterium]
MRIGLIDVDGHNFPNIPLMKLSAWHKQQGDSVEWYEPLFHGSGEPFDRVYMSKVFSEEYTPDYPYYVNANEVIKGGSGYCIILKNGKEVFDKSKDIELPYEVENIYPDYSIYYDKIPEVRNTAYGFLTRGCPRGCSFCHVADKEGKCSVKASDLNMFWNGQKNIVLLDPNITACRWCEQLFQQLIDSKAWIDFSQGLDIRMMTEKKTEMLMQMKIRNIHFAWDKYEDKDIIVPKFKTFKELTGLDKRKLTVYMLTNFDTTHEQDLDRVYTLRDLGYWPYVMVYNKKSLPQGHITRRLQRWVNMRAVFETTPRFEDYKA